MHRHKGRSPPSGGAVEQGPLSSDLVRSLCESELEWKDHINAFNQLTIEVKDIVANGDPLDLKQLKTQLRLLAPYFATFIGNLRSSLVKGICNCITDLAEWLRVDFVTAVDVHVVPALLKRMATPKAVIRDSANAAAVALFYNGIAGISESVINTLLETITDKKSVGVPVRISVAKLVGMFFRNKETLPKHDMIQMLLNAAILDGVKDPDEIVRLESRKSWLALSRLNEDTARKLLTKMPDAVSSLLADCFEDANDRHISRPLVPEEPEKPIVAYSQSKVRQPRRNLEYRNDGDGSNTLTLQLPSNFQSRPPLSQNQHLPSRRTMTTTHNPLPIAPQLPTNALGSLAISRDIRGLSPPLRLPQRFSLARPISKATMTTKRHSEVSAQPHSPISRKPLRNTARTTTTNSTSLKPNIYGQLPALSLHRSPMAVSPEHVVSSSLENGSHSVSLTFTSHKSAKPTGDVEKALQCIEPTFAVLKKPRPLPAESPPSTQVNNYDDQFVTPINNVRQSAANLRSASPASSRSTSKHTSDPYSLKSDLSEEIQDPVRSFTPFSKDICASVDREYDNSGFLADDVDDITLPRSLPVNSEVDRYETTEGCEKSTIKSDVDGNQIYVIAKNDSKIHQNDRLEDATNINKSEKLEQKVEGGRNCMSPVANDQIATSCRERSSVATPNLKHSAPTTSVLIPRHTDVSAAATPAQPVSIDSPPYRPHSRSSPPTVPAPTTVSASPSTSPSDQHPVKTPPVSASQLFKIQEQQESPGFKRRGRHSPSQQTAQVHLDSRSITAAEHQIISDSILSQSHSMSPSSSASTSATTSAPVPATERPQSHIPPALASLPDESDDSKAQRNNTESVTNSSFALNSSQLKLEPSSTPASPSAARLNFQVSPDSRLIRSSSLRNEGIAPSLSTGVQTSFGRLSYVHGVNINPGPSPYRMGSRSRFTISTLIPNTPESSGRSSDIGLSVALSDENSDQDFKSPRNRIRAPDLDAPFPTPSTSRPPQAAVEVDHITYESEQIKASGINNNTTNTQQDATATENHRTGNGDVSWKFNDTADEEQQKQKTYANIDEETKSQDTEPHKAPITVASNDEGAAQQMRKPVSSKQPAIAKKSSDEALVKKKHAVGSLTSKSAGTLATSRKNKATTSTATAGNRYVKRSIPVSSAARKPKTGPDSKVLSSSIGNTSRPNTLVERRATVTAASIRKPAATEPSRLPSKTAAQRKSVAPKPPTTSTMTVTVRPTANLPSRRPARASSAIGNIFGSAAVKKDKEDPSKTKDKPSRQVTVATIGRTKSSVAAVGRPPVGRVIPTSASNAGQKEKSTHAASSAMLREALRRPNPSAVSKNISSTAKMTATVTVKDGRPTITIPAKTSSVRRTTIVPKTAISGSVPKLTNPSNENDNSKEIVKNSSSGDSDETNEEASSIDKFKASIASLRTMLSRGRGDWRRRHEKMKEVKNGLETLDGNDLDAAISQDCITIINDAMTDIHPKMMVMALDCFFLLLLRTSGEDNSTALHKTLNKRIDVLRRVLQVCKDSKEDIRNAGERVLTSFGVQFSPEIQVALLLKAMNFCVELVAKNNSAARTASNNPSTTAGMNAYVMEIGCISIKKALDRAEASDGGFEWCAAILQTLLKAMFRLSKDRRQDVRHSANDVVKAVHDSFVDIEGGFDLACRKTGVKFAISTEE